MNAEWGMAKIGTDKPRQQAYEFAHRAVLAIARQEPARFCELAEAGTLIPLLVALWEKAGERLPEGARLPSDGMGATLHEVEGRSIVIVRPPRAEHTTEAHFIGVVVQGTDLDRYFVLEHSWRLDDTPSTWMGEWTPTHHLSLGDGSPPDDEDAFFRAVLDRIA
jgi:hypothetical protein